MTSSDPVPSSRKETPPGGGPDLSWLLSRYLQQVTIACVLGDPEEEETAHREVVACLRDDETAVELLKQLLRMQGIDSAGVFPDPPSAADELGPSQERPFGDRS